MAEGSNVYIPSLEVLSFKEETTYNEAYTTETNTSTLGILGEEVRLPDPEIEFHQHRNVGSGANLHVLAAGARRLSGSIPIVLQNGVPLKYLLGTYSVAGTDPYTHTITCANGKPSSMCLEARYDSGTEEFMRYYSGVVVTGGTIAAEEEGFLKCNLDIEAALAVSSTTNTPSSVSQLTTEPYVFCEGVATYFGSVYARVLDFNISVKRAFKARRYIQAANACYPYEINFGPRDIEMSTTIVAADDVAQYGTEYFNELLDPTSNGSTMKLVFTRGASDTLEIELTGCGVKSAAHPINPSAEDVPVGIELICKNITCEVVDSITTY